jgi:hypothetical protein
VEKHAGRPYTVRRRGLEVLTCDYRMEQSFSMGVPMFTIQLVQFSGGIMKLEIRIEA